jgi:malate permease and related proteins
LIFVALVALVATAFGVTCERRFADAPRVGRGVLTLMLYVLVPFVSFVNIAHLQLTTGAAAGLGLAYIAVGSAGFAAWALGRHWLRLPRTDLGALICTVIIVNSGYLGLPMTVALLGARELSPAVAYDQLVGAPMLLLFGFGIGATFGAATGDSAALRLRAFVSRNPPLLAVIAGLVAPASLAPMALVHASRLVVIALLPLGFYAVGINLSAERRQEGTSLLELPDRRVALSVALRVLVAPLLLACISALIIRLPSAYILQAAMPTGVNTLIVGHAYGLDLRFIATAIVWSTAAVLLVGLVIALA